jgi:hypothetical protein
VSVTLTGLEPGSEYHFRFVATNEKGPGSREEDAIFATKPVIEGRILAASEEAAESAKLNGEITSGPAGASYQFEYGIESVSEHKTPLVTFEHETTGGGFDPISAAIAGLVPGKTYHVKLVEFAVGSETALEGGETEFTTLVAKATIEEEFSENEGRHSVSLGGEINPKNSEASYFFEYGKTNAYGRRTSGGTVPAGLLEVVEVGPETVLELDPNTVYHYRLVTSNSAGKEFGPDETFMTAPPQLPIVEAQASSQVTQTTAILTATINPNGLPTRYALEVGTEVEGKILYTPTFGEVGSGTAGVGLTFALSGLQPGIVYHFRVVAVGSDGTVPGADQVFITPGFGQVIVPPPPPQIIPTPIEVGNPVPPVTPPETNAQKYKKALKLCAKKPKKKRAECDRRAKKQFGPVTRKHKKK